MRCVCVFALNCTMTFFYLERSALSSGGTIPPNHLGSVAFIQGKNNGVAIGGRRKVEKTTNEDGMEVLNGELMVPTF